MKRGLLAGWLILLLLGTVFGQVARQTGVIRGVITDPEGAPLPGVTVTVTSPALIGKISAVTAADGSYRCPTLPPGTYTLVAELDGFKTVRRENIIVHVGMIVTINLQMEPSAIKEEVVVTATAPTVDVQSVKLSTTATSQVLQRLPINRSLTSLWNTIPGAVGTITTYSGSVHGAYATTVTYEIDGVNANCPTTNGPLITPQYDAIEEVEIVTGGLPAQVSVGASFMNIVTKSGGNKFSGMAQAFYTHQKLNEILFNDDQLKAMGFGKPSFDKYNLDTSFQLGGPIIRDKIWFFGGLRYQGSNRLIDTLPDARYGITYTSYDNPSTTISPFLKITTQLSRTLRFFTMLTGDILNREHYDPGSRRAKESTFTLKNNWVGTVTGNLTWIATPNTFIDFRGGYVNRWFPIEDRDEYANNIAYQDYYTGYIWNGIHTWQSFITRRTIQGSIRLTHFQDNYLGGNHEFGAGVEYVYGFDRYGYARVNPLTWHYYNGSPYYYRAYYGLTGPHPIYGDGRISLTNCGPNKGDSWKDLLEYRIGLYVQDAFTLQNRLTLNLGVRYDYYNGWGGKAKTTGYPTGLAFAIGQTLEPTLGFNPFGPFEVPPIKGVVKFGVIQPRIGVTYDLFGTGKTAVKFAVSRYAEAMPVMWFSAVSPAVMAQYSFCWWDLNNNGQPDMPGVDKYAPVPGTVFSRPDVEYLKSTVDPKKKSPTYWEIIASINHELLPNFAVQVQYIFRRAYNYHGSARYDKATGRFWYKLEQAPEWWVPFRTIVPAIGNYPEKEITVYYPTNNSPWASPFYLQTNLPDSKRVYNGLELVFNKRYANGWALGGSVVFSRLMYFGGGGSTPNDYTNGYGRAGEDRPVVIKLYGTVELPYKFIASFFFTESSGAPYARSVSVIPPADWCAKNNVFQTSMSVLLEPNGSRRTPGFIPDLDLRLEKEFPLPFGRISFFVDIYNALGQRTFSFGYNPGGTWRPTAEGVAIGTYTASYDYGRLTGMGGVRTYKVSFRYSF